MFDSKTPLAFAICTLSFCSGLWSSATFAQTVMADQVLAPQIELSATANKASGLQAVLQTVLRNHPTIKGKQAEIDVSGALIESAEAGRLPTLSAQANNLNDEYTQGTLRLKQPLWAFGKIDTSIGQARAQYDTEQFALLQVQRQLIEGSAAAYAKVEGLQARAKVAKINITEHQRLFKRIKQRERGQLASEADVRLAQSRVLLARAQQERITGALQVALNELESYTLQPVAVDVPVDPALAALPSIAEIESQALAQDADVIYKRARLDVVRLDIKKEKIASMPTIYAQVEHELLDTQANTDRTRAGLVFEGSMEGLGFVSRGRVKGAEARLVAAQEDLNVAMNDIKRRINTLMANRNTQHTLSRTQTEVVATVEETMASFVRQYDSGRKTWIDVLNTQRELTEQRLQLAQYQSDWLILSLRIVTLTGALDRLAGIEV
ncbi:TolC family protein [Neptunomonas sp.]|uniref:TolC family protein n=1 Tax=Neptunomonas sp. TaxID=1971898 RepID=UPI0025DEAB7C|nr:TolC family protein [Neptunomonas sp.]